LEELNGLGYIFPANVSKSVENTPAEIIYPPIPAILWELVVVALLKFLFLAWLSIELNGPAETNRRG